MITSMLKTCPVSRWAPITELTDIVARQPMTSANRTTQKIKTPYPTHMLLIWVKAAQASRIVTAKVTRRNADSLTVSHLVVRSVSSVMVPAEMAYSSPSSWAI